MKKFFALFLAALMIVTVSSVAMASTISMFSKGFSFDLSRDVVASNKDNPKQLFCSFGFDRFMVDAKYIDYDADPETVIGVHYAFHENLVGTLDYATEAEESVVGLRYFYAFSNDVFLSAFWNT